MTPMLNRALVVQLYGAWLRRDWDIIAVVMDEPLEDIKKWLGNPPTRDDIIQDLKGKDLVCWCAPAACHADILLKIANNRLER